MILAAVLLKMGVYGFLRIAIPFFPEAAHAVGPVFMGLGAVGIVYGALVAWAQTDIKKLVAYSSISHLGFCVVGIFSFTEAEGTSSSPLARTHTFLACSLDCAGDLVALPSLNCGEHQSRDNGNNR